MKKLIFLFVLILAGLFVACDDYLEVEPENAVTYRTYFNTDKDLEVFMNGIRYDMKGITFSSTSKTQHMRGYLYDEGNSYYTNLAQLYPGSYGERKSFVAWNVYYGIISASNTLLINAEKPNLEKEREDFYKGCAYFYRGYNYGYIGRIWGEAPIVLSENDVEAKAKSSSEEVIDQAISDVKKASELLPTIDKVVNSNGDKYSARDVPSKEAAFSLLAHLYAWKAAMMKNNQELLNKAIQATNEVIKSTNIELAESVEELCTKVLIGKTPGSENNINEAIFEVQLLSSETSWVHSFYSIIDYLSYPIDPSAGEGDIKWKNFRLKNTTVDAMYTNGDERKMSYFYKFEEQKAKDESVTGGFAYPYKIRRIKKDDRWGGIDYIHQNAIVYRLADIILLRAECYAKLGQNGEAIADLNKIRERAKANLYDASEGDLQYIVFKEREKELLWERQRYLDVVRNGYWKTELKGEFLNLTEQDIVDGALYLPVIQTAFNDNPLMTQNKYWLSNF